MDVKATAKTVRFTPRKVRLVLDTIRGKSVNEALAILKFEPNQAATAVYKVVKSAAANATNNNQLNADNLYVKECFANEGVVLKRFMIKKSLKPSQQNPEGGVIEKEAPIDASNVMLYDKKSKSVSRVGYKLDGDKKTRVFKKSGNEIKEAKK